MRPYPGIIPGSHADTLTRHTEQTTDDALWELYRAIARLGKGQKPDNSGTPSASVTRHPDLADLNFSDDHAHHPWMLGRSATQEWYGLASTSAAVPGGIILHSNNSANTAHSRLEMSTNTINLYGEVRVFDEAGGSAGLTIAEGLDVVNITMAGTLSINNVGLAGNEILIQRSNTSGSSSAYMLRMESPATFAGAGGAIGLFEIAMGASATGDIARFYKPGGSLGSRIDVNGAWVGPLSGTITGSNVTIDSSHFLSVFLQPQASYPTGLGLLLTNGTYTVEISESGSGWTADHNLTIPDADGELLTSDSTAALSNKTLYGGSGGNNIIDCAATNGVLFRKGTSGTSGFRLVLTNLTAGRNWNAIGDLGGNLPLVGDQAPAVSAGRLGKVDLTGQTAGIASTNLTNTPPAGLYRVDIYVQTTTASGSGAPTLDVNVAWTDTVGATNRNVTAEPGATAFPLSLAATGRSSASLLCYVASGNIAYSTTINAASGSPQYSIRIRVTALG